MNDTPPAEPAPDFPGKPWALRLGAGLVAAFVVIVVLGLMDRAARPQLETAMEHAPVVGKH